jgi:hypothetical protein
MWLTKNFASTQVSRTDNQRRTSKKRARLATDTKFSVFWTIKPDVVEAAVEVAIRLVPSGTFFSKPTERPAGHDHTDISDMMIDAKFLPTSASPSDHQARLSNEKKVNELDFLVDDGRDDDFFVELLGANFDAGEDDLLSLDIHHTEYTDSDSFLSGRESSPAANDSDCSKSTDTVLHRPPNPTNSFRSRWESKEDTSNLADSSWTGSTETVLFSSERPTAHLGLPPHAQKVSGFAVAVSRRVVPSSASTGTPCISDADNSNSSVPCFGRGDVWSWSPGGSDLVSNCLRPKKDSAGDAEENDETQISEDVVAPRNAIALKLQLSQQVTQHYLDAEQLMERIEAIGAGSSLEVAVSKSLSRSNICESSHSKGSTNDDMGDEVLRSTRHDCCSSTANEKDDSITEFERNMSSLLRRFEQPEANATDLAARMEFNTFAYSSSAYFTLHEHDAYFGPLDPSCYTLSL